jgi:hypothetical protein
MEHKFMSKAWVREMEGKPIINDIELDIPLEVLMLGVTPGDKILHVGACDSDVNLIEGFEKRNVDVFYLGVDVKEEIKELGEKYKEVDHYSFIQQPIQQLIDDELADQYGATIFNYTIMTGVFNKPIYEDRHYLFISTLVDRCLKFSKNVIFTLDTKEYNKFNYSVLYVINNIINTYNLAIVKKLKKNNYIFCITQ